MRGLLKKTSAWLPIAMSLAALAMTLGYLALFGNVHHEDEGTPAHLFQLLMGGQVPIILFFVLKWFPEKPKEGLKVIFFQILAAVLAFAPIYFLEL